MPKGVYGETINGLIPAIGTETNHGYEAIAKEDAINGLIPAIGTETWNDPTTAIAYCLS